jgi:predicted metal-dependent HD superfamily phosphohydrolase
MLTALPLLDDVLEQHATQLGRDFAGYRNHAYRVANFCCVLAENHGHGVDEQTLRVVSVAAAFHDIGIWTDGTWDYLPPSQRRASEWLLARGHTRCRGHVDEMIGQHHKLTTYRYDVLVDAFRLADLADVSRGLLASNIPRAFMREVFAHYPNEGFHRRLVHFSCRHLLRHPLNPMPMLRW